MVEASVSREGIRTAALLDAKTLYKTCPIYIGFHPIKTLNSI